MDLEYDWVTQQEIGSRVRALRTKRGMSQELLARRAGQIFWQHRPQGKMLTIHWVMRLENARTNVLNIEYLCAIAAALGVPLGALILPEARLYSAATP